MRDISSLPPIYIYAIGKDIYAREPTPQEFSRTYDRSRFLRLDGQAVWLDGGARPRGVSLAVLALDLERGELWGWLGVRGPVRTLIFLETGILECIAERVGGEWTWLWIGGYFLSYGEDRAEVFLSLDLSEYHQMLIRAMK